MIVELLFSGKLSPEKLLKASSVFVPAPDAHCHRPKEEKSNGLERERCAGGFEAGPPATNPAPYTRHLSVEKDCCSCLKFH